MTEKDKAQLSPIEIFMKSWSVYQEVIENNYMFHREITQTVKSSLDASRGHDLIRILDLGCGDASMALPMLSVEKVLTYVGCDLSQPALDIAHQNLVAKGIPHQCICDDMLQVATEQHDESIDLVLSSYALHHLNALQKQQIVRDVFRMLKPGGCFVLIDIFREAEEDRPAYMRNYMGYLRANWKNLSKNSQDLIVDHATEYDFPETSEFYTTLCRKNGFKKAERIDQHTWHQAWVFNKPLTPKPNENS